MKAMRTMRGWLGVAILGTSVGFVSAQAPMKAPVAQAKPAVDPERPVAYVHGNIAITMDEFGKYLMDRGGAEKLELFVNKRMIEMAADARKITVTKAELEAKLAEDLKGIGATQDDFLKILLPKYNKSLYEWMEDVVKPGLLLAKMTASEVNVTDKELKIQFEREFGEKREIQMMMWPKSEEPKVAGIRAKMMTSDAEFDSAARSQANPGLASSAGNVKPVSRHLPGEDKTIEELAFSLKEGEVSEVKGTQQGLVCIKLKKIIPADPKRTFETEKARLYPAAFEEKLNSMIGMTFSRIRDKAAPQMLYTGPTDWKKLPTATGSATSITNPGSGGSPTVLADPSIRPAGK